MKLVTAKELAEMLGVCSKSIHRWKKNGDIPPPIRVGPKSERWDPDMVKKHLEAKK